MARERQGERARGAEPKRRITAPIDGELFRAVGAYSKWKGVPLGDVVSAALRNHLKGKGFALYKPDADADDPATEAA